MILLDSPASWPFSGHIIPGALMPSGQSYIAMESGQFLVAPLDVSLLIGYGFSISNSPGGTISVTDGTHTVSPATALDFTAGATVTDGGGGVAQVAVSGGGAPKVISATAYDLDPADNQPSMLVLSAGSATVVTVSAGVVSGGFTQIIVDMVGGGSVAVGSGVTLLSPNGSATASAGDEITIACPFDDVVVLGGSTS